MKMKLGSILIATIMLLIISAAYVIAVTEPEGPSTLSRTSTSRRQPAIAPSITAYAGNVTEIEIRGTSVTQTWQGFYGNITGTITLDDANNNTMYSWELASPSGEIYATELSSVNWTKDNIWCYNMSRITNSYLTLAKLEGRDPTDVQGGYSGWGSDWTGNYYLSSLMILGGINEVDRVNNTFFYISSNDGWNHESFYVGEKLINGTGNLNELGWSEDRGPCATVYLYNYTESNANKYFQEVLLYERYNKRLIYTALLNRTGHNGFNNGTWDFQMIVGENGHYGNTATTTYYFYVELE